MSERPLLGREKFRRDTWSDPRWAGHVLHTLNEHEVSRYVYSRPLAPRAVALEVLWGNLSREAVEANAGRWRVDLSEVREQYNSLLAGERLERAATGS